MHRALSPRFFGLFLSLATAFLFLLTTQRADALVNAGVEGGIVKRSADSPNNLKLGFAYGAHAEVSLLPLLHIGPYYLHYELNSNDKDQPQSADAAFNVLGLRARLLLPIPGIDLHPYGYVGIGYTWTNYDLQNIPGSRSGHFFEIPIGVGAAYDILPLFQISADVAYRPAVGFGGGAYSDVPEITQPKSGWSVLLGAALSL